MTKPQEFSKDPHAQDRPATSSAAVQASGFFDPDKVAKRRAFLKGIWDAVSSIDPAAAMGFLQMLIGLFGGAIGLSHVAEEDRQLDDDIHATLGTSPAATASGAGSLAVDFTKWIAFFKQLWTFISGLLHPPTTPAPAGTFTTRLGGLSAIGQFLSGLAPDKINDFVAAATDMMRTILGFVGGPHANLPEGADAAARMNSILSASPRPPVAALSQAEQNVIRSLFSPADVQAHAIDFSKIWALIQMIMEILAMFRAPAPPPPTSPTAFKDAEGKPLSNATGV